MVFTLLFEDQGHVATSARPFMLEQWNYLGISIVRGRGYKWEEGGLMASMGGK